MNRTRTSSLALAGSAALLLASACSKAPAGPTGTTATIQSLMQARNLSEENVTAALKTYTPTGVKDEYYIFASGGHSGQVIVIGVPSMRILKYIAVFTPEPWQGYGYGDQTDALLRSGDRDGKQLNWADTHHPALSETAGDYDGQYVFINDKANARVAVMSLERLHHQADRLQRPDPQRSRRHLRHAEHRVRHRGRPVPGAARRRLRADRELQGEVPRRGHLLEVRPREGPHRSRAVVRDRAAALHAGSRRRRQAGQRRLDLPQQLQHRDGLRRQRRGQPAARVGRLAERHGLPPRHQLEGAPSSWSRPARRRSIDGTRVIRLQTAIDEGILHFVGEPKSPHGVDVTPDGTEIVVAGKLDTHATVYSFEKIKATDRARRRTPARIRSVCPILPFEESIRGQVEIGLGPLHTQFDDEGNAYTSVFIESAVAKWSLKDLKVIEKIPVHYNIGHILAAEGDTVNPDGRYLVAMNKWALDRFADVGPLLPQNFQLIDIAEEKMQLLYDMPIPLGEPHYSQMIKADKIKSITAYTPVGIDPITDQLDPFRVVGGQEGIERKADGVHVRMTAVRSHFTPDTIRVKKGDTVHLHITNLEQAHDATHGFAIASYNVNLSLEPGEHANVTFKADKAGVFPLYCTEFCSALHLEMAGYLLVEP